MNKRESEKHPTIEIVKDKFNTEHLDIFNYKGLVNFGYKHNNKLTAYGAVLVVQFSMKYSIPSKSKFVNDHSTYTKAKWTGYKTLFRNTHSNHRIPSLHCMSCDFLDEETEQLRLPRAKLFPGVFLSPSSPGDKRLVLSPPAFHQPLQPQQHHQLLQPSQLPPLQGRLQLGGPNEFLPAARPFPHRLSPRPAPFVSSLPHSPGLINNFHPAAPPPPPPPAPFSFPAQSPPPRRSEGECCRIFNVEI